MFYHEISYGHTHTHTFPNSHFTISLTPKLLSCIAQKKIFFLQPCSLLRWMLLKLSKQPFLASQVRAIKGSTYGFLKVKIMLHVLKKFLNLIYTLKIWQLIIMGGKTMTSKWLLVVYSQGRVRGLMVWAIPVI